MGTGLAGASRFEYQQINHNYYQLFSPVSYIQRIIDVSNPATAGLHLFRLNQLWAYGSQTGTYRVTSMAGVHDQNHAVTSGVTVYGTWTLPDGSFQYKQALSNTNGIARFNLQTRLTGTFQFCVTDMVKSGYEYDAGANEVPACKSIAVGQ